MRFSLGVCVYVIHIISTLAHCTYIIDDVVDVDDDDVCVCVRALEWCFGVSWTDSQN